MTAAHTLYARWTEGGASYTVNHLWQNIEDDDYTQHESEEKSGTTSQQTAAEAKSYTGFTAQSVTQAEIKRMVPLRSKSSTTEPDIRSHGRTGVTFCVLIPM